MNVGGELDRTLNALIAQTVIDFIQQLTSLDFRLLTLRKTPRSTLQVSHLKLVLHMDLVESPTETRILRLTFMTPLPEAGLLYTSSTLASTQVTANSVAERHLVQTTFQAHRYVMSQSRLDHSNALTEHRRKRPWDPLLRNDRW
jgi:hypothetical protein